MMPIVLVLVACVSFDTENRLAMDLDGDGLTQWDGDCDDPEDLNCDLRPDALDLPYANCTQTIATQTSRYTNERRFDERGWWVFAADRDDGVVTDAYVRTLDDLGNPLTWDSDLDGDGIVDERMSYTVVDGLIMQTTLDIGVNGSADEIYYGTRDESGRVTRVDGFDGTGTPISIEDTSWTVDEDATRAEFLQDSDADGAYDASYTSVYNADPKGFYEKSHLRLSYAADLDYDGNTDEETAYERDAIGRLLTEVRRKYSASGRETERKDYVYAYDSDKRVESVIVSNETTTSQTEAVYTYTYDCP